MSFQKSLMCEISSLQESLRGGVHVHFDVTVLYSRIFLILVWYSFKGCGAQFSWKTLSQDKSSDFVPRHQNELCTA